LIALDQQNLSLLTFTNIAQETGIFSDLSAATSFSGFLKRTRIEKPA
jgi:hypothetical protein